MLKELEIRGLSSREELQDYIDSLEEDNWVKCPINQLGCIGVNQLEIDWMTDTKCPKCEINGYDVSFPDIDPYDDNTANEVIMLAQGLFIAIPDGLSWKLYPAGNSAFTGILDRAGDKCATMLRVVDRSGKKNLEVKERARRLNDDFKLYSSDATILIRWGKVMACHSGSYVVFPVKDIVSAFERIQTGYHPDMAFESGEVSNEMVILNYDIKDELIEDTLRLKFEDAGVDVDTIKAMIRVSTSDTANSAVRAVSYFEVNGTRFSLGGDVHVDHIGNVTLADVEGKFEVIGSLFQENLETIERLGNVPINDVGNVLLEIRKKYTFLNAEITNTIAGLHKGSGTAVDVYLALCEIVQRQASSISMASRLNQEEMVERLLRLPFEDIDAGKDWKPV